MNYLVVVQEVMETEGRISVEVQIGIVGNIKEIATCKNDLVCGKASDSIALQGVCAVMVILQIEVLKTKQSLREIDGTLISRNCNTIPVQTHQILMNINVQMQGSNILIAVIVSIMDEVRQFIIVQVNGLQSVQLYRHIGHVRASLVLDILAIVADRDIYLAINRCRSIAARVVGFNCNNTLNGDDLVCSDIGNGVNIVAYGEFVAVCLDSEIIACFVAISKSDSEAEAATLFNGRYRSTGGCCCVTCAGGQSYGVGNSLSLWINRDNNIGQYRCHTCRTAGIQVRLLTLHVGSGAMSSEGGAPSSQRKRAFCEGISTVVPVGRNSHAKSLTCRVTTEKVLAVAGRGGDFYGSTGFVSIAESVFTVIHTGELANGVNQFAELNSNRLTGLCRIFSGHFSAIAMGQLIAYLSGADDLIGSLAVLFHL